MFGCICESIQLAKTTFSLSPSPTQPHLRGDVDDFWRADRVSCFLQWETGLDHPNLRRQGEEEAEEDDAMSAPQPSQARQEQYGGGPVAKSSTAVPPRTWTLTSPTKPSGRDAKTRPVLGNQHPDRRQDLSFSSG